MMRNQRIARKLLDSIQLHAQQENNPLELLGFLVLALFLPPDTFKSEGKPSAAERGCKGTKRPDIYLGNADQSLERGHLRP